MALGTDPGCSLDFQVVLIRQAQQMVRLSLGIRWSIGAHEPRHRFAVVNGRLVVVNHIRDARALSAFAARDAGHEFQYRRTFMRSIRGAAVQSRKNAGEFFFK